MTDSPRVSVIMPVFDAGRDLEQAVRSVAAQTFTDRELVIVDDGSRDPTTLAVLDTIAREPGVSLHRRRPLAGAESRHRARPRRVPPATRCRRPARADLSREDGPTARRRRCRRGRAHLGRADRSPPWRLADWSLRAARAALTLHHPRHVAVPARDLAAGRRLRPDLRRQLGRLGPVARRDRARLDGPLRARGAHLVSSQRPEPRGRGATAGRQPEADAGHGGEAPPALRAPPRGRGRRPLRGADAGERDAGARLQPPGGPGWSARARPARAMEARRLMPRVSGGGATSARTGIRHSCSREGRDAACRVAALRSTLPDWDTAPSCQPSASCSRPTTRHAGSTAPSTAC